MVFTKLRAKSLNVALYRNMLLCFWWEELPCCCSFVIWKIMLHRPCFCIWICLKPFHMVQNHKFCPIRRAVTCIQRLPNGTETYVYLGNGEEAESLFCTIRNGTKSMDLCHLKSFVLPYIIILQKLGNSCGTAIMVLCYLERI